MSIKLVAAAIIVSKGKVLLARRKQWDSHQGFWEFPGGAVERGETLEECLAREILEELGVSAEIGEVIARNEHRTARGGMDLVALRATVDSEAFSLSAHDAIEWVAPRDLESYRLAPADVPIAAALRERTDLFRS
jgi:8-oxo-dGTP diphosphatase